MTRILNQPVLANTSYLPGSQASSKFAPEMIMLFWEITQCNKRFRSFIIDTNRSHDFVILILFYALEYKTDASKQGVVRMCVFILQTLSVETNFGSSLNTRFGGQDTLPASIRIPNFHGTYADFLIHVSRPSNCFSASAQLKTTLVSSLNKLPLSSKRHADIDSLSTPSSRGARAS